MLCKEINVMLCALIMAGGRGERFWPLSTEDKPKQFLKLIGEDTMLQMTVKRLLKLIPMERIFIVTGKKYVELVKEQLPKLPERNIIVEPVGRNTAPCIGLSAFIIDKYYKDAAIAVVPSDHLIIDEDIFRNTISAAYQFVKDNSEAIVTIGMKPNRPDTGYGYIEYEQVCAEIDTYEVRRVKRFVEKPNFEKAIEYLRKGTFLWNGGMFIWKVNTILELTQKYLNRTYAILNEIAATDEDEFNEMLDEKYVLVDNISVDYGIMEKAQNIFVIPGDFGWDDVGTWYSVERITEKDQDNNVCVGSANVIDGINNVVYSSNKQIITVGLNDIFVVESEDIILIASKNAIEDIKEIKNTIEKQ
jgi:mannose-1-phosphate guanylyltransferase